jgi:hypothetical protein
MNQQRLDEQIQTDKIKVIYNSEPVLIGEDFVDLSMTGGTQRLPNNFVYVFAGGEPPFALLRSIGIQFN